MILAVISDSHGRPHRITEMLERQECLPVSQRPTVLLHLGDGVSDCERVTLPDGVCVFAVRGNCDGVLAADHPYERVVSLAGFRILMMHGHTRGVKSGLVSAMAYALQEEADLLLYGHTHEPFLRTFEAGTVLFGEPLKKPLTVMNPGALGEGSFGIVRLSSKGILASHGRL